MNLLSFPFLVLFFFGPFTGDDGVTFSPAEMKRAQQHRWTPLPADPSNRFADHTGAAQFGQFLFFETGFSRNGEISCATCHLPELGFADGRPLSVGLALLDRHSPSLWNTAFGRWFFWDGRRDSLWAQALQPIEDEREMGSDRLALLHFIYKDPSLRGAYESLFGPLPPLDRKGRFPSQGKPPNDGEEGSLGNGWHRVSEADRQLVNRAFANIGKAIAAYERRLLSGPSRFDVFLDQMAGEESAGSDTLNRQEQRGFKLFLGKARCRLCHSGPQFSDFEFHNTGVPPLNGGIPTDSGRYGGVPQVLGDPFNGASEYSDIPQSQRRPMVRFLKRNPENWGQFKTPGLRNISQSAPYMHQGQLPTLEAVVDFYNTLQDRVSLDHHPDLLLIPLNLTDSEKRDLVAFLKALDGPDPEPSLLAQPKTPKP